VAGVKHIAHGGGATTFFTPSLDNEAADCASQDGSFSKERKNPPLLTPSQSPTAHWARITFK
jgi:hypothetical protein